MKEAIDRLPHSRQASSPHGDLPRLSGGFAPAPPHKNTSHGRGLVITQASGTQPLDKSSHLCYAYLVATLTR